MLPEYAPQNYYDRQTLWTTVEQAEKRSDSRTAREIVVALPRELALESQVLLLRSFVRSSFVEHGMCADITIHSGDHYDDCYAKEEDTTFYSHNPHCHIMLTTRHVGPDGFSGKKCRVWDKRERLVQWRKDWADDQNRVLQRKGFESRVSHESNKTRGIDREPTRHLGPVLTEMERRGIRTDLGNENRAIEARNKEHAERQRIFEHRSDWPHERSQ